MIINPRVPPHPGLATGGHQTALAVRAWAVGAPHAPGINNEARTGGLAGGVRASGTAAGTVLTGVWARVFLLLVVCELARR